MNKTLGSIVGVIAAVALVIGFVAYNKVPETVVGSQGMKGDKGDRGEMGLPGTDGEKGDKGDRGPAGRDGKDATQTFGGAGSEFYFPATFYGGAQFSATFATTSNGAGTLTASNITNTFTILSTNSGVLTLTMPASSTLSGFIPRAGDRASMVIVNQGTALLTLAGGTGTLLQTASSTKAVNIGGTAELNFVRKTNSDIVVNMSAAI